MNKINCNQLILCIFTFLLIFDVIEGKSQSECELYFIKAADYYNIKKLDSAIFFFKKSFKICPDSSVLHGRSIYNIAKSYNKSGKTDSALFYYKYILTLKLNDKDPTDNASIMGDPYENYSYWSCNKIYQLYLGKNQLDSCLHYLYLADTVYKYQDDSKTDIDIKHGYLNSEIAYVIGMKGDIDKAYSLLKPAMNSTWYRFYSQEYFFEILINKFGKKKFKKAFDKQLRKMKYPDMILFRYTINIKMILSEKQYLDINDKQKFRDGLFKHLKID